MLFLGAFAAAFYFDSKLGYLGTLADCPLVVYSVTDWMRAGRRLPSPHWLFALVDCFNLFC